jgi:hypothetical protein
MKTALLSILGMLLAIVYIIFFSAQAAFSLILIPISWVVIVWMLHGLSRAYIVTLAVGILLDLHYFNFGLMTVILLAALSAVYFIHITVISSTNAASTLSLGFIFALIVYVLLLLSSGLTNGFHYYSLSWGLILQMLLSALVLSAISALYCWLYKRLRTSI